MNKLENFTITEIEKGLRAKKFSAREITLSYLDRIGKEDTEVGAFLEVFRDSAIEKAEEVDEFLSRGEDVPELAGIPVAVKDNILIKDTKATAGSRILENYKAVFDATVMKKLKKELAIIIGKTNLDEFAMGASTEHSAFQKTKNPLDKDRVPGGSSGGSAAAVANNECVYALGSDTGGSIRQPAAFCGVVGLKPTYGSVSRYGLIAFASSLDQIGPITKNVSDAEIVFNVIKGGMGNDSTLYTAKTSAKTKGIKDIKIGLPKEYFSEGIEPYIKESIEKAIGKLREEGINFVEISLPHTKYAIPVYYLINTSEASANLARYDGIRYGTAITDDHTKEMALEDIYARTREMGFGTEVKRRIMLGTYALSAGYYDEFYIKAQKVRTLIKGDFDAAFKEVDLILSPTSPIMPFRIGEKIDNPISMYMADVLTAPVNLAGLPAISIPFKNDRQKLPIGIQIIAPPLMESQIFDTAKHIEKILR